MKPKGRRGRVPGRVRDKEIEEKISGGASWADLLESAVFGAFSVEHLVIAREYDALLKRSEEIGNEYHRLGDRFRNSVCKWLTLARGRKYHWPDGYTPDELHRGAKKDKARDKKVYQLILKQEALSRAISELDGKTDRCVGELFRQALYSEDVQPLRLLEALVGLFRSRQGAANPRLALYLKLIRKDERGEVCPTTIWSVSELAVICGCDRRTIRDWHKLYGVTSTQGKRGPRKKS